MSFQMLQNEVVTALEYSNTPEKLRDAVLVLDCAQRAEAASGLNGGTTNMSDGSLMRLR